MFLYSFYVAANSTLNSAATIDILVNGRIRHCEWTITPTSVMATNDYLICQLSELNAYAATNNAQGIIATCGCAGQVTTSGAAQTAVGKWCGPMDCPVKAGQRLYLNVLEAGSCNYTVWLTIGVY